jgi:DNA ligase-associated metallophosphoesterase
MQISLADQTLRLLPQRAIYWTEQQMLIVADIHFGKAAAFRANGVPVPEGTTSQNLAALDALIAAHEVRHILFLGDFLHAKAAHATATLSAMRCWRAAHPQLHITLVRGNHDAHAGDPPSDLMIALVDEPHRIGPFAFCHHPQHIENSYVLAGHIHPVYRLAARGDSLRLPCFLLGPHCGVLPSFGAFTGGLAVTPQPAERLFVATDDAVFEVPPH